MNLNPDKQGRKSESALQNHKSEMSLTLRLHSDQGRTSLSPGGLEPSLGQGHWVGQADEYS